MVPIPPDVISEQLVYLDPVLLDRARVNAGLSLSALASHKRVGVALNTVRQAIQGAGLQPHVARLLAGALGNEVSDLLAPWDPRYIAPTVGSHWQSSPEWEAERCLEGGRLAPNGLYYIVSRMRHRHLAERLGRGKYYHLGWMSSEKRQSFSEHVTRHARVCERLGPTPHVSTNLALTPVEGGQGWWVVDAWVGGTSLACYVAAGAPRASWPMLLLGIAEGLAALHGVAVVFRELAPARVLIAEDDGRAVLSDFELARLTDGAPSVSAEWPEDPFRAPEVTHGDAPPSADLYSFAMLAASLFSGAPTPTHAQAEAAILDAGTPKGVWRVLRDCLAPLPADRPSSIDRLLVELRKWQRSASRE